MKPEEMQAKLDEIEVRRTVLLGQSDLDDKEVKELEDLNLQSRTLSAKLDGQKSAAENAVEAKKRQDEETDAKIAVAVKAEREKFEAQNRRLPFGEAPYQAQYSDTWKYDGLNPAELSLVIDTLESSGKKVSLAAYKAMALKVGGLKDEDEQSRKDNAYIRGAFKMATGIEPKMEMIEAAVKTTADVMYTGGTTDGGYWVGAAYSTDLWRVIRANCLVAVKVPEQVIPDNYPNISIPLEGADMTWYKVAEATLSDDTIKVPAATIAASKVTTPAQKTISVGKLGSRCLYTGEMVEDSLIAFVPTLRSQLEISGAEILESLMIDGDSQTTSSTNINKIEGTPGATDYYLLTNGFRKLALVTNTANSRSASGSLAITDYIDTLKLMGTAGLGGSDPSKVAFIVDGNVHYANMKLPEVATRDVHSAATIENGFLKMAYNIPIIPSWQMHRGGASNLKRMANTAGKVDSTTDTNNTTGAILAVRFDQWKQAFKRRMTMETTRIANADSWEIVALARWGMAFRDNEASAETYNVGI